MIATRRRKHRTRGSGPVVPVVLPQAVITAAEDGTLAVTLDGEPFDPPEEGRSWRRSNFAELVDALSDGRRVPVRIEVRAVDGARFTDIIAPIPRREPDPDDEQVPVPVEDGPGRVVLEGEGFLPGEEVAVAIVTGTADVTPAGLAHAELTTADLEVGSGEVVLFG